VLIQVSPINLSRLTSGDNVPPSIKITYPSYPPTLTSSNITIKGITNDSNGIKAISADAHTFPFNGSLPIKPAITPSLRSEGNWSKWSIPFVFNNSGVYRIVVTVRDNSNNLNYAETTINVALSEKRSLNAAGETIKPKIAFVRYTFTEAAYGEHGFYDFYFKYGFPPFEKKITTDLDMLTVKSIPPTPELIYKNGLYKLSNVTALIPIGNEFRFWIPFINHVKKDVPNATVTVMRDEDVDDGHIFYADGGNKTRAYADNKTNATNAYDVLLLFHNEYATQKEYDNLRQFVKNGGTIVFIDANVFYAEVRYDKDNHKITLVKGHDWEFDGKAARSSVEERWYNETKDWVGGNFIANDIKEIVTFANNPFNYKHFEEQFVNNPKAKIIIDYDIKFPPEQYLRDPSFKEKRVATYTLDYGKGKVIMLGLTGHSLAENKLFLRFFDNLITKRAFCPHPQPCMVNQTSS
jgi:hypothetical protein